jgi:hypothetical protein
MDKREFKVGDEVKYSAQFLKNIGCGPTDELWFDRGFVESEPRTISEGYRIVKVRWIGEDEPKSINCENLCKKGELSRRTAVL